MPFSVIEMNHSFPMETSYTSNCIHSEFQNFISPKKSDLVFTAPPHTQFFFSIQYSLETYENIFIYHDSAIIIPYAPGKLLSQPWGEKQMFKENMWSRVSSSWAVQVDKTLEIQVH